MEIRVENNSCPIYVVKINGSFVEIRIKKIYVQFVEIRVKKQEEKNRFANKKYKMNKKGLLQMVWNAKAW